jgi:zinc transport system permease protein
MEIFEFDFMIRAFIAGIFIALIAPSFGMFAVVKRYAMLSDTLAHIALLGVAIGFLFGFSITLSTILISALVAVLIEYIRSYKRVYSDSVLSIFLSSALAFSIIIVSMSKSFNSSLFDYLFGSIVAVSDEDIIMIVCFFIVSLIFLATNYNKLLLSSYNEELAIANGINVKRINIFFTALVGVSVAIAIKIIGALLIGALMIIPVISAIAFKKSFFLTWMIALAIGVFSVIVGLFISFYFSYPSGATIVVILFVMFCLSLMLQKIRYG